MNATHVIDRSHVAFNTFMRDARIQQSRQMYMSKRHNRIVVASNANTNANTSNVAIVVDDATRVASIKQRDMRLKIDATLKSLRDVQSRDDKRDASNIKMQKRIRRNLRKMGYYISRERVNDATSNVA